MKTDSSDTDKRNLTLLSLIPFMLIAFGLAWGILALFIFLPDQMIGIFGELTSQHPLFYLAVYAPAIAAFIVVIYNAGIKGFRHYLGRLLIWRCSLPWYAFLIFGIPLIYIGGAALKGNLFTGPFQFSSFQSLILALILTAIKGPVEEFGWRGVALPLLQRKMTPICAALILGIIWGFWHLPAFLLSGTQQSAWSFTPFFFGSIALSVIVTALFNTSRGSILLPALFHFFLNNPVWPDAQPYDIYLFMVVAVLVVWFNRKKMFNKKDSITDIIPRAKGSVSLEKIQKKPLNTLHRKN